MLSTQPVLASQITLALGVNFFPNRVLLDTTIMAPIAKVYHYYISFMKQSLIVETDVNECSYNLCDENTSSCTNTDGGYYCLCKAGYLRNGTECIIPINTNTCANGTTFDQKSGICVDIDECLEGFNGGCDWHVSCTNSLGGRVCGSCPPGTNGTGDSKCLSTCGDGICDSESGENCVTCNVDCSMPCNTCGDGLCDMNESCSSCSEDCLCLSPTTCLTCSEHGTCIDGLCNCSDSWSGPSCSRMLFDSIIMSL